MPLIAYNINLNTDRVDVAKKIAAAQYARAEGFAEKGYRVVINCNGDGGQTVFHLHVHLLAGRPMQGGFG